jgi:HEAT repeat protein
LLGILLACTGCGKGSTAHWIGQLKAEDSRTRIQAIHTLQERKADAEEVVPALTEALNDENTYVRRDAARALGSFGAAAAGAIPTLQTARRDREPSVRKAAGIALGRIDPQFAAPTRPREGRGK